MIYYNFLNFYGPNHSILAPVIDYFCLPQFSPLLSWREYSQMCSIFVPNPSLPSVEIFGAEY